MKNQAEDVRQYKGFSQEELSDRIEASRRRLGEDLVILGHHYQREHVAVHADFMGDSLKLSQEAARKKDARTIVFCGVHFMAECADLVTTDAQAVILPNLDAGCPLANMANLDEVESAWDEITRRLQGVIPITYINSAASLKAFVGNNGGIVCTSSNAEAIMRWAFKRGQRIFFFPDQHLGRYTARKRLNMSPEEVVLWDRSESDGGLTAEQWQSGKVFLWNGHCNVHTQFRPEHVEAVRNRFEQNGQTVNVIVHPECPFAVCEAADAVGSTEFLRRKVIDAPEGTAWAIGTENHFVGRLMKRYNPSGRKTVVPLNPTACQCATMFRISPEYLCWVLEALTEGRIVNQIIVPDELRRPARLALERMLDTSKPGKPSE